MVKDSVAKVNSLPREIIDRLTDFYLNELASKAVYGISYAVFEASDKEKIKKYKALRELVDQNGYAKNEVFRMVEFSNGVVFDIDNSMTSYITKEVLTVMQEEDASLDVQLGHVIKIGTKARDTSMLNLAKHCLNEYKNKHREIEIVLFRSDNSSHALVNARVAGARDRVLLKYEAYMLKHWDLELVNKRHLIKAGIKINGVKALEILPNGAGVLFKLAMKRV